jgi:hypothetical protein
VVSDDEPPTRTRVHRLAVGTVPLLVDESASVMVTLVQRTWTSSERRAGDAVARPSTRSPVGVEVRRHPPTEQGDPGGMTPAAARALSRALADAAGRAEEIGTNPLENVTVEPVAPPKASADEPGAAPTRRTRRRRAS